MLDRYGVARGFETRLKRTDGSSVLVRNTARAHRGADGAVLWARSLSTLVSGASGDPSHVMVLLEDLAKVTEGAESR